MASTFFVLPKEWKYELLLACFKHDSVPVTFQFRIIYELIKSKVKLEPSH